MRPCAVLIVVLLISTDLASAVEGTGDIGCGAAHHRHQTSGQLTIINICTV